MVTVFHVMRLPLVQIHVRRLEAVRKQLFHQVAAFVLKRINPVLIPAMNF